METNKLFWQEEFKVRAYEAGPDGRVTIHSVCNYLQEAAANHAVAMKVAMDTLKEQNLTWVLSRLHVRMNSYPFWNQVIRIETWPAIKQKLHAIRDFRLMSGEKEIGTASSSWMMIDLKRRRAVPIPGFMDKLQNTERGRTLEDPFDSLPVVDETSAVQSRKFFIRMADLDMNQHVNSVHYLSWALETVPAEIWQRAFIRDVEINYRSECRYGDVVVSRSQVKEDDGQNHIVIIHQLFRETDEREVSRIVSTWRRK